ncbi:MAG: nitroreductase family protein [Planctomycetota bacterium]
MSEPVFVPLPERYVPDTTPEEAARAFCERMATRRSIRMFSDAPVSRETIEWIVRAAGGAPSGANKQPWHFVAVSDPALKRRIREGAEQEERAFYERRASERWLEDLAPLGTDEHKEYLEIAPWLVVVFLVPRGPEGEQHYYAQESVGLASGLLLAAAHHAGLATLTHTPSPMGFLNGILGRPEKERPYLLVPIGYPADGCTVPAHALEKKPLEDILEVR